MSDLSPLNQYPLPAEYEEPYYQTARDLHLALDAATYQNAENSQLQFMSEGNVGWDKDGADPNTGILYWSDDIFVSGYTTPYRAKLSGPASIELREGEVLYFVMPRQMNVVTEFQLYRSNRIYLAGTRLHALRLFCARVDDVVYFYNGKSLKDGDYGALFGGGLISISIFPPHEHMAQLVIEPAPGTTTLDALVTSSDGLANVDLFRNGHLQATPADYSMNLGTGIATLVIPSVTADRFILLRELRQTTATTTHTHLTPLRIAPLVGTTTLDMLITDPLVNGVDLYRNGMLQVDPDDYSFDSSTGFVTLVIPSVLNDIFVALRRANV